MNSVTFEGLTFKEIERNFFEIGCEIAVMLMQSFLERVDKELAETRNKSELRHKGKRTTTFKTLMGEVTIDRNLYKKQDEDGGIEHIYLLDQALGLDTIGTISPNLVEKILENSCEMSFREVASSISELTNQSISHQGVWNVVQAVGEKQVKVEKELIKAYRNDKLSGEKEVSILFEEADGLWLSMQGKSREKASKGKKELKIGIVYEGWEKRYLSSKEYKAVEKQAFAGYLKPEEFKELRDAAVAAKYNVDEIKYRVLNGDGAAWIRNGHNLETSVFQLDPYHLTKSIIRNVKDKRARKNIMKWLRAGEFEKVFKKLEELKYQCDGEASQIKKLTKLEEYIQNNKDGIVNYKERENIEIPNPPEEIEYRNLGIMERNVNIFAKRMKRGKSWSEDGATNLAKIIALKIGPGFKEKIAALVSGKLPERLTERFEEKILNTREVLKETVKKSVYPLHRGKIPFSNCKRTNGRQVIRSLFNMQDFHEMVYR